MLYKRIVMNEPHASVEGLYDNQLTEHQTNNEVVKKAPYFPAKLNAFW